MADNVNPVILEVKDFAPREVIFVDYKFNQQVDKEGQMAGIPRGGKVTIRVKAMNDGNNQMVQWKLAPYDPRDMKVKFINTVNGQAMKELDCKECYCVKYTERWEDGKQHYEEMEIVCKEMKNGPVEYKNPWK